jgi:Tfp pilus assembly protein PilW
MKILRVIELMPAGAGRGRRAQAFTLAEMMISVFIFVFMVLGVIYVWMFGMRYDELALSKLGASDKSRMSFDLLTGEIRSAKSWSIGNIVTNNKSNFTPCGNATAQVGNALSLTNSPTDTNAWVRYWFDTNGCQLCRGTNNGVATSYQIIAQNLTNTGNSLLPMSMAFHAEQRTNDNLVTNISSADIKQDLQFKYVIAAMMEFSQYQYPLTRVGPGYYYNYYCIQIKAASHCPN